MGVCCASGHSSFSVPSASRTKAFRQWVSVCSLLPPLQRLLSVCLCAGQTCLFSDTAVSTESICGFKRHDELSPMKGSHCSPADFSGCPLTWWKTEFLETGSQAEDCSPHLQIPVEVCVSHLSFWGKIYTPSFPCPFLDCFILQEQLTEYRKICAHWIIPKES